MGFATGILGPRGIEEERVARHAVGLRRNEILDDEVGIIWQLGS